MFGTSRHIYTMRCTCIFNGFGEIQVTGWVDHDRDNSVSGAHRCSANIFF